MSLITGYESKTLIPAQIKLSVTKAFGH